MLVIKEHHFTGYEKVIEATDQEAGLKSLIAIHSTALGPALGGVRMYPYATLEEAFTDVLRLAEGMTYKSAVAETGLGGGKSVIMADPKREKSERLFQAFAQAVNSLRGRYICAEDMGTTPDDMAVIRQYTQYVVALDDLGSSGNPSPFTAWGVYRGIQAVCRQLFGSDSVRGRTVAIQGLGSVGRALADHLFWEGAELILSDVEVRSLKQLAYRYGARVVSPEEISFVECDILCPCARGGTLNPDSIPRLRCRAIAGCANNQLLEADDGIELRNKGILYAPDFVINAGGIINVSVELEEAGYNAKRAKQRVDAIYDILLEIFRLSNERGKCTSTAALELAKWKLDHATGKRTNGVCFPA